MKHLLVFAGLCLVLAILLSVGAPVASADTAEELKAKIDIQNQKIAALQKEIAAYEASLVEIGKSKSTLQGEVNRLDTSRKQIGASISVTENKITTANLQIQQLGEQIGDKETRIQNGRHGIEESLRTLMKISDTTLVERYFSADGLVEAWEDVDRLSSLQGKIKDGIAVLEEVREDLTVDRDETAKRKAELSSLKAELSRQKSILDQNRQEQAALLTQTKNKESEFQKILTEKQTARAQFEQELQNYESQLKYTLDPSTIPTAGSGVLQFPLDATFMSRCKDRVSTFKNIYCITQYYGDTPFAQSGAYKGSPHNGIDFGSPQGTKVTAALSGTVLATGNTDAYKGCYSYGKWVLIKHGNGLTTLYAHLSLVNVGQGDSIPTGGMLGYSGKTGYATGPHLHFTVFASDAVKIIRMADIAGRTYSSPCDNALVPVSGKSGYLDPMSYLL